MVTSPLWKAHAARLIPLREKVEIGLHVVLIEEAALTRMPVMATEMLMYDKANPMGDGYSTEMEAYDIEEYKPQGETE